MLETLTTLFQPWADLYADSAILSTAIIALHIVAMFVGGGIAVGADRQLLTDRAPSRHALDQLAATHRWVVAGLVLTTVSGIALATADLQTFAGSWVFWSKMATFGLLIGNGIRMQRLEVQLLNAVRTDGSSVPAPSFAALRTSALVSVFGWLTIVVLGVVLSNS